MQHPAPTTSASGAVLPSERLADWSSMVAGAFAANTPRASGVLDPTSSEEVKLALKEMGRKAPARQR